MVVRITGFIALLLTGFSSLTAQQPKIDFEQYEPASTLVVPANPRTKAVYPFIDVHNHQYRMGSGNLESLVTEMDRLNLKVMVNLSGGNGDGLKQMVANARTQYPGRFIIFANLNFTGIGTAGWIENTVKQLEADVRNGANGLKIFKNLGFSVNDAAGKRVTIDDPRLDPVWAKCGELKIPVLIHTADPEPFWDELDNDNERLLELYTHPRRKRSAADPAPWETLIGEQHRMFKKHPGTTFIAAHFGWYANDLGKLDSLLLAMPNVMIEFGAVIAELGRQPRAAAAFFNKHQDRILFGKDSWVPSEYATYFRVLETSDEYFPYHKKYHAFWRMYGMGLPDAILKKVYFKNALRIIPGIDRSLFPE
ncbi:amidohydrolase family protein [Flavihumibacter stibioxidans]|uniref:Amidohydrolase n=1 Tax=Flavihumibacter stibioxidans TaxID=1834163 RepID=A0ABR7MC64_9BACT|nr:amidohydrolase family protein [Flavihumibacter stibioxidans]MBC6492143.1 amidohydrolase [Flavihumibacter stibioxidans]